MTKQSKFPPGWDAERVERVHAHYESQTEEQAVAEDEAAVEDTGQTFMASSRIRMGFDDDIRLREGACFNIPAEMLYMRVHMQRI